MKRVFLTFFFLFMTSAVVLAGPFDLIAKHGMRGQQVTDVQVMLFDLGYYNGIIDGVFGQKTEESVKLFQSKIGITQDGIVTKQVMRQMVKQAKKITNKVPTEFAKMIMMEATAYTSQDPGCGLYTARGNLLHKGLVAVDPRVIPLGTRLYIPEYGYAIADDTGGDIKGNRIDLAYESRDEAFKFGRRMIEVYILK